MFNDNINNSNNTKRTTTTNWTGANNTAGDSRTSDGVRPTFIDGDVRDFEDKDHYGNDSYLSNYRATNSTLGDRNDAGVRAVANERGNNTFLDMSGDGTGKNSYSDARDHDRSLGFSSSLNDGNRHPHHLGTNSTLAAHERDEARVRDFANNRGNNTFLDMSGGGPAGSNASNNGRGTSGSDGVDSSTVHDRIHGPGGSFGSDNQSFNNKTSNTSNVPATFIDDKENYGNRVSASGSAAVANDKSKQTVNKPVDASLRGATTTTNTHSHVHSTNYTR